MALLFLDSFEGEPPANFRMSAVPDRVHLLLLRCPSVVVETDVALILRPDLSPLSPDEKAYVLQHCPWLKAVD